MNTLELFLKLLGAVTVVSQKSCPQWGCITTMNKALETPGWIDD